MQQQGSFTIYHIISYCNNSITQFKLDDNSRLLFSIRIVCYVCSRNNLILLNLNTKSKNLPYQIGSIELTYGIIS